MGRTSAILTAQVGVDHNQESEFIPQAATHWRPILMARVGRSLQCLNCICSLIGTRETFLEGGFIWLKSGE